MAIHIGPDVQQLTALAIRTLRSILGDGSAPCCHALAMHGNELSRIGVNPRYGKIALIGLSRAGQAGLDTGIDTSKMLKTALNDVASLNGVGDIGLTCWATAMAGTDGDCDRYLKPVLTTGLNLARPEITAMEMQWLLTGVCKLYARYPGLPWLEEVVDAAHRRTSNMYNETGGLFNNLNGCNFSNRWKRNLSYFCDQVYGIYALCAHHEATGDASSLERSVRIAENICALQRNFGEWPWLYDSSDGTVASFYPIYSVHQDSMAPMALLKLDELSGSDFAASAARGIPWLFGENEMGVSLVDDDLGVIWRSIRPKSLLQPKHMLRIIKLMHISRLDRIKDLAEPYLSFEIDRECRPYHLGWILYAFCGR
jgi:hypothetical protein